MTSTKIGPRYAWTGLLLPLALLGCGGGDGKTDVAIVQADSAPKAAPAPAPTSTPAPAVTKSSTPAPTEAETPKAAAVAVDDAAYGTIKGRVIWADQAIPEPRVLVKKGDSGVKDAAVCAVTDLFDRTITVDPASKGMAYVFAYLNRPSGDNPALRAAMIAQIPAVEIDQKNCEFIPYSSALMVGQDLLLKSSDPVNHNVRYTPFNNKAFNQILPPNASTRVKLTTAERAPTEMKCDIHPWMSGRFLILDHPFLTSTGPDGSFEIKGVPPGDQKLVIRLGDGKFLNEGKAQGMPVKVEAGKATEPIEIKVTADAVK